MVSSISSDFEYVLVNTDSNNYFFDRVCSAASRVWESVKNLFISIYNQVASLFSCNQIQMEIVGPSELEKEEMERQQFLSQVRTAGLEYQEKGPSPEISRIEKKREMKFELEQYEELRETISQNTKTPASLLVSFSKFVPHSQEQNPIYLEVGKPPEWMDYVTGVWNWVSRNVPTEEEQTQRLIQRGKDRVTLNPLLLTPYLLKVLDRIIMEKRSIIEKIGSGVSYHHTVYSSQQNSNADMPLQSTRPNLLF